MARFLSIGRCHGLCPADFQVTFSDRILQCLDSALLGRGAGILDWMTLLECIDISLVCSGMRPSQLRMENTHLLLSIKSRRGFFFVFSWVDHLSLYRPIHPPLIYKRTTSKPFSFIHWRNDPQKYSWFSLENSWILSYSQCFCLLLG